MIPMHDALLALPSTVAAYFTGERQEMWLILGGSALFFLLAAWLWLATRTGFAAAFVITVLAGTLLLSATAGSLLLRDRVLSATVIAGVQTEHKMSVIKVEHERIAEVVSKYRYYRYGVAVIGLACMLGLLFSSRDWVHGVVAGLLLLVIAQVVIDHYSEHRNRSYMDELALALSRSG